MKYAIYKDDLVEVHCCEPKGELNDDDCPFCIPGDPWTCSLTGKSTIDYGAGTDEAFPPWCPLPTEEPGTGDPKFLGLDEVQ